MASPVHKTPKPLGQDFKYNDRVAAALLPALVVFTMLAEPAVAALLVVGLMVAYMLDVSRQKELALTTVWITLGLANTTDCVSILVTNRHSSWLLALLAIIIAPFLLVLVGVWATLQFRFIAVQFPVVAHALENILVCTCGPVAMAYLSWALLPTVGASATPFYAAAVGCSYAAMFVPPLEPSYMTRGKLKATPSLGGSHVPQQFIQTRLQAALLTWFYCFVPAALYAAVHLSTLPSWDRAWDVALLLCGSIMFFQLCPRALWWLPEQLYVARLVIWGLAFNVGVAALEQRVVLVAFGAYVKLPAPWSWIIVTMGMYTGAALVVAYFGGLVPHLDPGFIGVACIGVCTAGGISIGLPMFMLPFALLAGGGLALYQEAEKFPFYAAFVIGAGACAGYFIYANFWFLDVVVGGVHLRTICSWVALALMQTLLLPGLVRLQAPPAVVGVLFVVQGMLLALAEEHLYAGDEEESYYPAYLVCATSVMGLALARRLVSWRVIGRRGSWALLCIYGGKLAMLFLPDARPVLPVIGLLLASTPPLVPGVLPGSPAAADLFGGAAPEGGLNRAPLKRIYGLMLAKIVLVAVAHSRFVVFDGVQALHGGAPPEGVLLGALLVVVALAFTPLVYCCYPYSVALKRYLFLLASTAVMLMVMQPPVPLQGGARCPRLPFHLCPRLWDERHRPSRARDDLNVYAEGLTWKDHWVLWLLFAGIVFGVLAGSVPERARRKNILPHLTLAMLSGALTGAYLSLEFLPHQVFVQPFIIIATLVLGALIVLINNPALVSTYLPSARFLVYLPINWMFCFFAAFVTQSFSPLPPLPVEAQRLFTDEPEAALEAERRSLASAAIYSICSVQGLLLALVLKLKVSTMVQGGPGAALPPSSANGLPSKRAVYMSSAPKDKSTSMLLKNPLLSGIVDMSSLETLGLGSLFEMDASGSAVIARLRAQGLGWMPTVLNAVTMSTVLMALMLNFSIGEGRDEAIFAVAPLLLLLHADPTLMPLLSVKRRYFPPFVAIAVYLTGASLTAIFEQLPFSPFEAGVTFGGLLCTLPNLVLLGTYLWNRQKQSHWPLLFVTPLNIVAGLFSTAIPVQLLAGVSLLGAGAQVVAMQRTMLAGKRII